VNFELARLRSALLPIGFADVVDAGLGTRHAAAAPDGIFAEDR
jgi:hypothetical protein